MNLPQPPPPKRWDQVKKLWSECKSSIEEEIACDTLKGPDHPDCEKLFLRNEDCYQRALCTERWKEALDCVNSKSPGACEPLVKRSRACKETFFAQSLSPTLRNYLSLIGVQFLEPLTATAATETKCEPHKVRYQRCVSVLGHNDKECLDREIIYNECFYSNTIPKELWDEWKTCKGLAGDEALELCTNELEDIRLANYARAEDVCKSVGLLRQTNSSSELVNFSYEKPSIDGLGGPEGTLEILTKVYYGSHYGYIFKDYDPRFFQQWEKFYSENNC